jgi:signal transduction histidine kinase
MEAHVTAIAGPPAARSASGAEPGRSGSDDLGGVLRDYVRVAQRLAQTHETLQREVLRLRTELESKDRELERRRRLASLGELAAGVAHEVRNPLGAIQLYSDLLRGECQRLAPALKLIEKIEAGVRAIDAVVRDTLALAPRGGGELEPQALRGLVEKAADFCQTVLTQRGVSLSVEYENPDVVLLVDEGAIQRVLVNLISNAAEASPRGTAVVVQAGDEQDGLVELRVLDQGPGLPPEVIDRIFDPFFTTKPHGTGLGLTIAHRLVEAHGGGLRAQNRAVGGAEFVVTLPVGGATGMAAGPESSAVRPSAA